MRADGKFLFLDALLYIFNRKEKLKRLRGKAKARNPPHEATAYKAKALLKNEICKTNLAVIII